MLIVCKGGELCPSFRRLTLTRLLGPQIDVNLWVSADEKAGNPPRAAFPRGLAYNLFDGLQSRQQPQLKSAADHLVSTTTATTATCLSVSAND